MTFTRVLAEVMVGDHDAAVAWYAQLLGRAPDTRPMDGLAEWRLTETGWLQVFSDPERAGRSGLTLGVDDLDAHAGGLAERGIALSRQTISSGARVGTAADPDGNTVVLVEELRSTGS